MATITLKNVPDELQRRLQEHAERHQRSLNLEALHCLEEAMSDDLPPASSLDPEAFLTDLRRHRIALVERGVWLTEQSIREAIDQGRP